MQIIAQKEKEHQLKEEFIPRVQRIGKIDIELEEDSMVREIYGGNKIQERYRHRYGFNQAYGSFFEKTDLSFPGKACSDGIETFEILELKSHKFFVGVQFHPEFKSRPFKPSPLIKAFLKACLPK